MAAFGRHNALPAGKCLNTANLKEICKKEHQIQSL